MPKFEFVEENVKKNPYDFPKLRLKKGEVARVVLLEDPVGEYTHELKKLKLVNGIPEEETKTRKDGTQYKTYKTDYISRVVCLGDLGTLQANGSDPERCPACAEAAKSDMVPAPKRRFAMHVIKYSTTPSGDVATPFQVSTAVWAFTDKVFGELFDIKKEWKDLRIHDLILKCDNEDFQNYKITVGASAAWTESDDTKKLTAATLKNNRAEKLELFCGTPKEAKYIEMDIQQIKDSWAIATGASVSSAADDALSGVGSLTEGLDDLFASEDTSGTDVLATEEADAVGSFDDLLGSDSSSEEDDSALAASVGAEDDADDLDSLLNGI